MDYVLCFPSTLPLLGLVHLVPSWTVRSHLWKVRCVLELKCCLILVCFCVDMLEWYWLRNVRVTEAHACCPQTHEAGRSHGAFYRQYCLQDWCGYCEARSNGESQTKKKRCVGKTVRWSDRGKKPTLSCLVTICMACLLLALLPTAWLGKVEGVVVKIRWVLWQWPSDFSFVLGKHEI